MHVCPRVYYLWSASSVLVVCVPAHVATSSRPVRHIHQGCLSLGHQFVSVRSHVVILCISACKWWSPLSPTSRQNVGFCQNLHLEGNHLLVLDCNDFSCLMCHVMMADASSVSQLHKCLCFCMCGPRGTIITTCLQAASLLLLLCL